MADNFLKIQFSVYSNYTDSLHLRLSELTHMKQKNFTIKLLNYDEVNLQPSIIYSIQFKIMISNLIIRRFS